MKLSNLILATTICMSVPIAAHAQITSIRPNSPDAKLCIKATAQIERAMRIPDGFLGAISRVEAGLLSDNGKKVPWPWTINVDGEGYYYESQIAAINAVKQFQSVGHKSIDVGCMQINVYHHSDAFSSIEFAFDPYANARYAGRFLMQMKEQTGSWPRAAAAYHSMIESKGTPYLKKVLDQWAIPQDEVVKIPNRPLKEDVNYNKNTMPTNQTHPITQVPSYRPMSIMTPQQAEQRKNNPPSVQNVPTVNGGGINNSPRNNIQALVEMRRKRQESFPTQFRPFKGNFRLNNPPAPHPKYKTATGGMTLSAYRKNTVHEVSGMPMPESY